MTGRMPTVNFNCRNIASSTGGAGTSSLRLPVEVTRGAPSAP